eukprot:tig00020904_g15169.t1
MHLGPEEAAFSGFQKQLSFRRARLIATVLSIACVPTCAYLAFYLPRITSVESLGTSTSIKVDRENTHVFTAVLFGFCGVVAVLYGITFFLGFLRKQWQMTAMISLLLGQAFSQYFFTSAYAMPAVHVLCYSVSGSLAIQGFRLPWLYVMITQGTSAISFIVQVALRPDIRDMPDYGISLILGGMMMFMMLASSYEHERELRKEFARVVALERNLNDVRIQNERLTNEVDGWRSFMMRDLPDLSSPLENALGILRTQLESNLREKRLDDATRLADAIRYLLSTTNLNAPDLISDIKEGTSSVEKSTADWLLQQIVDPLQRRDRDPKAYPFAAAPGGKKGDAFGPSRSASMLQPPRRSVDQGTGGAAVAMRASLPGVVEGEREGGSDALSTPLMGPLSPAVPVPEALAEEDAVRDVLRFADSWENFDVFRLADLSRERPLQVLSLELFRRHGIVETFNLEPRRLSKFLEVMENGYKQTPYHSRTHAADVLQGVHFLLTSGNLRSLLRDIDIFALLFSAIIHDFEHTGRNNAFECATSSERALLYNDRSVLENVSASRCFALLRDPELDILDGLSKAERQDFRKCVIAMVLATDLTAHFDQVGIYKAKILPSSNIPVVPPGASSRPASPGGEEGAPTPTPEERQILLNMALKVADLGNAARTEALHLEWVHRVMSEFFLQGDDERSLGLNISPYCDRQTDQTPKCQIGFMEFLALPLFSAWSQKFPGAAPIARHTETNRRHWQQVQQAQGDPGGGGGGGGGGGPPKDHHRANSVVGARNSVVSVQSSHGGAREASIAPGGPAAEAARAATATAAASGGAGAAAAAVGGAGASPGSPGSPG